MLANFRMFGVPRDLMNRTDQMNPERPLGLSSEMQSFGSPPPTITSPISNDLVVRALNYHGQQLTSFMKEKTVYQKLDLKNVDYHLYHQRSRELKMEDRGKRLLLHRLIIILNHFAFFFIESSLSGSYHKTVTSCSTRCRTTP